MTFEQQINGSEKKGMLETFLAKPCDHGYLDRNTEGAHVALRNNMQFILAIRRHGENKEGIHDWLDKYSKKFGDAMKEIVDEDHLFFDGYDTLGEIPEEKWQKIENKLYN